MDGNPMRGDEVEAWLNRQRDSWSARDGLPAVRGSARHAWYALDDALNDYRLHADTRTPLSEEVTEGRC